MVIFWSLVVISESFFRFFFLGCEVDCMGDEYELQYKEEKRPWRFFDLSYEVQRERERETRTYLFVCEMDECGPPLLLLVLDSVSVSVG